MRGDAREHAPGSASQGLTLALNAAEGVVQIAIADGQGRFIYSQQVYAASRGAEVLSPALNAALVLLNKTPRDIDRIAVVRGPGSFTGLRLTAATAAGFARAVGARQAGLDYMDLLARECLPSLNATDTDALLWALARARRDLVYMRGYFRDTAAPSGVRGVTGLEVQPGGPGKQGAERLLEMGADINKPDVEGRTLLHHLIEMNQIRYSGKLVEWALEKGADARAVDDFGKTPLDYARERQNSHAESALLRYGAVDR